MREFISPRLVKLANVTAQINVERVKTMILRRLDNNADTDDHCCHYSNR